MTQKPDNLDEALRSVLSGALDRLTPEQVAGLENFLNENPQAAARLARQVPPLEPALHSALNTCLPARPADAEAWKRVGERVLAVPARARVARQQSRILRLWVPLAAAACLAFALTWRLVGPAPAASPPLALATDLEIERLEVYDDATPFVVSVGDSGAVIVWVLEDQS